MPFNPAQLWLEAFSAMNHPYLAAKFREGWLLSDARSLCCLFIVVLCLSDIALVNAQTRVAPPPPLGIQETPVQVQLPPPVGRRPRPTPPGDSRAQTPRPDRQGRRSVWFNVGW